MIVVEFDVIAQEANGANCHAGTFKFELPDEYFGTQHFGNARMSFSPAYASIGSGQLIFRVTTRPKNRPVVEDPE